MSPVVKEPGFVKRIRGAEFLFEVVDETLKYVFIRRTIRARLVIDLPSDYSRIVFVVADQIRDDPLGIHPEGRIVGVHILRMP